MKLPASVRCWPRLWSQPLPIQSPSDQGATSLRLRNSNSRRCAVSVASNRVAPVARMFSSLHRTACAQPRWTLTWCAPQPSVRFDIERQRAIAPEIAWLTDPSVAVPHPPSGAIVSKVQSASEVPATLIFASAAVETLSVVPAIDQHIANAGFAHFAEDDFGG